MNVRPLHDRIVIKRLDEETKTAGGLFIPDSAKEKPIRAGGSSPSAPASATRTASASPSR